MFLGGENIKLVDGSKVRLVLLALLSLCVNGGQTLGVPIFYNHPEVRDIYYGSTIRPGSIEKIAADGTRSTVVSGLCNPSGIDLDDEGNLYYGNVTPGSINVNLFKRTPAGTVTSFGQVVDMPGGSISISGWGFDVAVPEPATVLLLGLGGLALLRKRRA